MPEVIRHSNVSVASMRKLFEQQAPKDAAKDTLVNERNSLNSRL